MYMVRLVRFFGVVGPRCASQRYWWADIAFSYAKALVSMGVRFIPIGGAQVPFFETETWTHWKELAPCFTGELASRYVNVVCAPPGLSMGRSISGQRFAPPRVVGVGGGEVDPRVLAAGRGAEENDVYKPESALCGLWTEGVRNIAITAAYVSLSDGRLELNLPGDREIETLKRYDAVLTPNPEDAEALIDVGVAATWEPAGHLARDATHLPCIVEVLDA